MKLLRLTLCAIILLCGFLYAKVPSIINYQGRLKSAAGSPVADGDYLVKFGIYNLSSGGTAIWDAGYQTVTAQDGFFSVSLGASPMPAFPATLFSDTALFLGVKVGTDPELAPRVRLTSVAFAMRSIWSDTAANVVSVPWSNLAEVPAGFADGTDDFGAGDITAVTAGNGLSGGGTSDSVSLSLNSLISSSHTFNSGTIIFGDSTMRVDVNGISIGGVNAPQSAYLINMERKYSTIASAPKRGINLQLNNAGNGGLYGFYTRLGETSSADGGGVRYGVYSVVDNMLSSNGVLYGVIGVAGNASKTAGNVYGIRGDASAGPGASARGVYGAAFGSGDNYAGYFSGRVYVNGELTKSSGAFKIDHPLDPENKYLQHSFVESPDMMNIYNGNAVLDEQGEATVTLPEWFEALNQDFRYQLTAVGAPGPNLFIAKKVSGNRFTIAGGTPGMEVSWQVTGVRHDAYAAAHRIQVEIVKPARERGTYLAPEAFGQPITKHINYEQIKEAQDREKQ